MVDKLIIQELENIKDKKCMISNFTGEEILYHYTDANAFIQILQNKRFHISHQKFMNDSMEIKYINSLIPKAIDEVVEDSPDLFGLNSPEIEILKNQYEEDVAINNSEIYRSINLSLDNHILDSFVLSLSSNRDSLILWSNYANFNGYNIGLKVKEVINIFNQDERIVSYEGGKVLYDKTEQMKILKKELDPILKLYINHSDDGEAKLRLKELIHERVKKYSKFFKHESFSQEEEYRFIFKMNSGKSITKYKPRKGIVTPFIELPTFEIDKLPLKNVMAGPSSNSDIAAAGAEYLLKSLGYDTYFMNKDSVRVEKSEIPIRF